MAFNRDRDKDENDNGENINKALEEAKSPDFNTRNLGILKPSNKEKKARFQFTLEPSVRKKIEKLANDNGYSSSSEFLNELIKNI
ncbi:CopG family transcriptional regulator [Staphylococcus equorum]|uniref:CopG family transcriptional regulator n=1 Tax=Staphylococcus equorum TaxID=246432 RepID=UPI0037DA60CC